MEVAEFKMLLFSMGITRKDKIKKMNIYEEQRVREE